MDEGLRRAGWRHIFLCESDKWRQEVLVRRFPGVPIYEDVCAVAVGEPARRALADGVRAPVVGRRRETRTGIPGGVDLLAGGFPCQDVSTAGRRAGLAGGRSGLFFEFARIVDALRPRFLLIENVPGLFSSNGGRDFGIVLGTLVDLGYGLGWRVLDSRFFGVPQLRRRVFIVGVLADGDPRAAAERAGAVLAIGARCERHPPKGAEARPVTSVASLSGLGASVRRMMPVECERLQALPDNWTRVPDAVPDSRRYAALGDAVTVSVAEWIGRRLLAAASAKREAPEWGASPQPNRKEPGGHPSMPAGNQPSGGYESSSSCR